MPLQARLPEHGEELDPRARGHRRQREQREGGGHGEERHRQRPGEDRQQAGEQRPRGRDRQASGAAEQGARALGGQHQAPGGRPAQGAVGHYRAEHGDAPRPQGVAERRLQDDHPQPAPRRDRPPAARQLPQEPASGRPRERGRADAGEQRRAGEVGERVEGQRPAGSQGGHQRAAKGRAAHARGGHRERQQGVGGLQVGGPDHLRHDPAGGGEEQREGGAAQRFQGGELPQPRAAREHEPGRARLRPAGKQVSGDHDPLPRQAVRPHPAEQQEGELGRGVRREHQPQVGGGAAEVEDGEGERHRRHGGTQRRACPRREQPPEVPPPQGRQPARRPAPGTLPGSHGRGR